MKKNVMAEQRDMLIDVESEARQNNNRPYTINTKLFSSSLSGIPTDFVLIKYRYSINLCIFIFYYTLSK